MDKLFPNELMPRHLFFARLARSVGVSLLLIILALFMGMCGYHYFENLAWIDAFTNASMILSGMGPVDHMNTQAGKIFAGTYALFSGLFFILVVGLILAPLMHRFFHKLKLEEERRSQKS